MRIHELAKKYNVASDELIQMLQNAGHDIKTHMSTVNYDMLEALERHFNWAAPAKKKKTKAKKKSKAVASAEAAVKAKVKVKARLKGKVRLQPRVKPKEEKAEDETKDVKKVAKTKAKVKTKAKTKAKTEAKAETGAEPEAKAKAGVKTKAAAETKTETKAKTKTKTKTGSEAKTEPAVKPAEKPEIGVKAPRKREDAAPANAGPVTASPAGPKVAGTPVKPAKPDERARKTGDAEVSAKTKDTPKPATRADGQKAAPGRPGKKPGKDAAPAKDGKKPKKTAPSDRKRDSRSRKSRAGKTPEEIEAQRKAVRESVRRTLAKMETTRKTKRRKTKASGDIDGDVKPVQVQDKSSISVLADALEVPVEEIIECCEAMGVTTMPGQELDKDVIDLIAEAVGRTVEIEAVYGEARLREGAQIDPANLLPRSPVVTVMGHVDHGKTSILDYIRETRIVDGEAGGITQHIGAYEVDTPRGRITFIDTPGHEAFTAMRSRGAQLTDIVVLVVAADDGVMPQTIEAINHTKASGVPMVLAINKIDLPGANPDMVKQQLTQQEVVIEEYGGDVVGVEVSAKTGEGIDKLLEMILLQAELLELNADPKAPAQGVVIESKKEEGRGILCTVLVQHGTLRVGDVFVVGNECGKVRSLLDDAGKRVKEAPPSVPVQILGFNGVPVAGDSFITVKNEREAREISIKRQEIQRTQGHLPAKTLTLEDLYDQVQLGEVKELNIIIKGDTDGSVEALRDSLSPMSIEEIKVNVVHTAVGAVSESDVLLADSTGALIIAFHTTVAAKVKEIAKSKGIEVRKYDVVYEAIEDVDKAMKGMLTPEIVERVLGRAEVRKIFRASKLGLIAGSMVIEGTIERNAKARVFRAEEMVFEGKIVSLKRFQDDVKEVSVNFECGIGLSGFDDLQETDMIEAFVVEEKSRVV